MLGVPMGPLGSLARWSWLCPPTLLQFLDQENRMSRTQLLEVEARLKSSLAALQQHSLQYEELMDSHQRLRYRPRSPPLLEPLYFWEIQPGGVGTHRGTLLQPMLPQPSVAAQAGGRCCGEAQQTPSWGKLPKSVGFAPPWVMVGGRREKCPHPTLKRGNAAPAEADAILQGRAGCPQQGAGEHQGRAPRLTAQEGQSLLVLCRHR